MLSKLVNIPAGLRPRIVSQTDVEVLPILVNRANQLRKWNLTEHPAAYELVTEGDSALLVEEDIADLAAESVTGTAGEAYHDRGDFLHRLAVTAHRPGFTLPVAETTVLIGCAFGYPVDPDGSGRRGFDGTLQEIIQRLTSRARFVVLTRVVAHPHTQHRDIARRLQQRLLTDLHSSPGVTLLHPADRAGQAAFSSWGRQNMGEVVGLPGPVVPCVSTLSSEGQPSARR